MRPKTPSFDALIQNHGICLSTEGRSQNTIDWYASNLRRFLKFLNERHLPDEVNEIGIAEARSFIFYLQNEVTRWESSLYTRDKKRLSPFSVQGYISVNPMEKMKIPKVPKKIIATFTQEQIKRMIAQLDLNKRSGYRNYTIILLLLDSGIRLSELINIKLENVDFKQSSLLVRDKGNKERVVLFGTQVRRILWRYVSSYRAEPQSPEDTFLLLTNNGKPLQRNALRLIFGAR